MCSPPDVYVQALYDFEYETEDGKQVWMREGEEYLLLKKTNGDWWQVIRDGDKRPFYAPANYVEEIPQPGLPLKKLKKIPPTVAASVNGSGLKGSTRSSKHSSQNVSSLPPLTAKQHKIANSETTNNSGQEIKKRTSVVLSKTLPPKYPPKPDLKMQDSSKAPSPAPVQLHPQIIVPNPVYSLEHTTLLGKANYKKDTSVSEQSKDVATKNEKEKDNRLITEEQDKNRRNKDLRQAAKAKKVNELSLKSLQPQPPSPIYVNFPLVSSPSPPSPHLREFPLRCLDGNWAEYEDLQGRKYYYNHATKEKSWKPPRRRSDNSKPSSANSSKEGSPNQDNRDNVLGINLHSPTPSSIHLPPGWSRKIDPDHNEVYYVNDITKEKWFTSTDESGHIYYFQENASESFWQLPEVVITEADLGCKNKLTTNTRLTTSSGSLANERNTSVIPSDVPPKSLSPRRRPMSVVDRGAKTRSMVLMDTRTTGCVVGDEFREARSATLPKSHTSIILDPHKVLLQGNLSKTKVSEGGKKMRKNWAIFYAVLTDTMLIFFKDLNKPVKDINANKADSMIELTGSQIEWAPDKSTRKNVFQATTACGQQYLLQDDDAQSAKKWFEAIQNGIKMRPFTHERTISLSSGTSPEESKHSSKIVWPTLSRRNESKGSVGSSSEDLDCSATEKKTRIRDKLKFFFLRRPTMESLQEQGIIKDEPVFGCTTLTALCSKENTQIPKFVQNCIAAIEKKDMTADGLYRASGNLSQIQKIRFQVNQDNLEILNTEEDIHVLTGALKMFFRELKEPLFPFNTFEKFLKAITLPDNAKKVKEFKDLIINFLPKPNYYTLKALLEHLLRVTKLSDKNRMHIQNLAIVFGPTLMWSATDPVDIALDVIHQNQIIEFLLLEYNNIFR